MTAATRTLLDWTFEGNLRCAISDAIVMQAAIPSLSVLSAIAVLVSQGADPVTYIQSAVRVRQRLTKAVKDIQRFIRGDWERRARMAIYIRNDDRPWGRNHIEYNIDGDNPEYYNHRTDGQITLHNEPRAMAARRNDYYRYACRTDRDFAFNYWDGDETIFDSRYPRWDGLV